MAVTAIDIGQFLAKRKIYPVIDVRSLLEYTHAHIPGAFSLPLFSDEERKVVGTIYKQVDRQKAIKQGLTFFGPKMNAMIEEAEKITSAFKSPSQNNLGNKPNKTILVHCWRGGMRSAGVAWLLDLYGFKVYTLIGGYKSFRQWCHRQFEVPYIINVVGGYTGSGKTLVIHQLNKQQQAAIDLEGLANHKGSAFGGIGMEAQPTQEMFENLLGLELSRINNQFQSSRNCDADYLGLNSADPGVNPDQSCASVWLEDESQRIGNVNLPPAFWLQMRKSRVYFLDIPFEERLNYLVNDYGKGDKEKILNAIVRIKKRLGGLETKMAVNFLLEDNLKECFRILLLYYDKYYLKGLHNRDDWKVNVVPIVCPTVSTELNTSILIHFLNNTDKIQG